MKVMVACEFSGVVRDAFLERGIDAVSCDLVASERKGPHIIGDIRDQNLSIYDMIIAFPPCTYLAVSGRVWWKYRQKEQQEALDFVRWFMTLENERIALENPVGCISTFIRKPDQYIEPYWFGDAYRKKTGLWLKGLRPLEGTNFVIPDVSIDYMNDTPGVPRSERQRFRSRTPAGIASAMALQWGNNAVQE